MDREVDSLRTGLPVRVYFSPCRPGGGARKTDCRVAGGGRGARSSDLSRARPAEQPEVLQVSPDTTEIRTWLGLNQGWQSRGGRRPTPRDLRPRAAATRDPRP